MEFEMPFNQGGCLCGAIRYATSSELGSPIAIANSVNVRLDQRTWSNPSSPEGAFRSFRENLRFTIMSRKEAESGSLSISARPAVQSCFWTLNDFPKYLASTVERSMTRTGLTARRGRQDTSS